MYGAGLHVFAVWGYVISHARDGTVELNPKKLADTLGGTTVEIESALTFLTSPDPRSRCKEAEGRRLVKEGEYQYRLPSWEVYRAIRDEVGRKEQNRKAQAKWRASQKARASQDRRNGIAAGVDHDEFEPRHGGEGE